MLRLATALTLFWELRGHLGEGCRWFSRALAHDAEPSVVLARAHWGAAHAAAYHDDEERARDLATAALAMATDLGDEWTEARALNTLAYTTTLFGTADARPMIERSINLGLGRSDAWVIADGLKMLTIDRLAHDDLDGLAHATDELRAVAESLGNGFFLAWADAMVGFGRFRTGDFVGSRAAFADSLERCREVGDPATGGVVTAFLADTERRTGEVVVARARIEDFMAHANATGGHLGMSSATLTLIEIMRGGTEQDGACTFAGAMATTLRFRMQKAWAGILLGATCRSLGDLAGARDALHGALELADSLENDWLRGAALHELGLLERASGDHGSGEGRLHDALAVRHRHGLTPDVAETIEALATLAADHESLAEAARLLGAAAACRQRIGLARPAADLPVHESTVDRLRVGLGDDGFATAWADGEALDLDDAVAYVARARGERKRPSVGWASLTPTEARVVDLVVDGLTNPQIDERLFISRGTVKTHLSHVFAKLGVTTRAELAGRAARRPPG